MIDDLDACSRCPTGNNDRNTFLHFGWKYSEALSVAAIVALLVDFLVEFVADAASFAHVLIAERQLNHVLRAINRHLVFCVCMHLLYC